jgi:hypothetical protein
MKNKIKILLIIFIVNILIMRISLDETNSVFGSKSYLGGNLVTTGDWTPPPVPKLYKYISDDVVNSSSNEQCWEKVEDEFGGEITYHYESYDDENLGSLRWGASFRNSKNSGDCGEFGEAIVKDFSGAPEGDVYWRVKACDERNNCSDWSEVGHFIIDNTAPVVEITYPSNGDIVSGEINLRGLITEENLWRYFYRVRNTTTNENLTSRTVYADSLNNETFYTWDTTGSPDGEYWIHLAARDKAGNRESESEDNIYVTVDNPPSKPTGLTIYEGYGDDKTEVGCDGTTNSRQITIEWNDNPEEDIDYYWLGTQFNTYHKEIYAPKNFYEANMTPGHNPYYYTIIAVDKNGNQSEISDICGNLTLSGNGNNNSTAGVVINEVYYDVDTDNRGSEGQDEWVELYNNSDTPVSLKDWTLTDNAGTKTITANKFIGPHEFVVISHDNRTCGTHWGCDPTKHINLGGSPGSGWLNNDGDYLILKNASGTEVDFVAWESGYDNSHQGWSISAGDGQSIARVSPGFDDNNNVNDWEVLGDDSEESPNPGTNPHSHIQVDISRNEQDLIVDFDNAEGFDKVKYSVFYQYRYEGEEIDMQIEGEKDKPIEVEQFSLDSLYFGSCSSLGVVCTPHRQVENVEVHLLYKNGNAILGSSSYDFDWQN